MKSIMNQLILEKYSEKSFVVRGNTKEYKDELIRLKGKWNPNLIGGPGYIFSNLHLDKVKELIPINKLQVISYNIYVPDVKEKGILLIDDNKIPIEVRLVIYENNKLNSIVIFIEDSGELVNAIIINGEWQIRTEMRGHSFVFGELIK